MAVSQEEPHRAIKAVGFAGLVRADEAYVRGLVRVVAGDRLDRGVLDAASARLLRSGRFVSATYRIEDEGDGVRVVFQVGERPVVSAVKFEGNHRFTDDRLDARVSQPKGQPVDWLAVREGRDAIIAMYREAGFGDVAVTYDQERLQGTGELVYTIDEGARVRIRRIVFRGNASISHRRLLKRIDTKPALWIFRSGAFDKERAESDVARLQGFYRDEGFLDARVGYEREVSEDGRDLVVVFAIEEGAGYVTETIEFRGSTVFERDELLAMMASKVGDTVKRRQVAADARAIRARYGELGYIYADVAAGRVFSDKPGLVHITINVSEGAQYRVGRVTVRGNARTRDKVVRRALNLYPPDDLFDLTAAKDAEQRLLETRIFSAARVYAVGDQPNVRDVVIDVQEAQKAGDFLFGAGVTSNSGLVGNIVLDLQNFDLADRPKSWSEFFRFRSFVGGGQRFRLELQPGSQLSRFRLDFTEPYLFDRPIRFDFTAFLFNRRRDGYREERVGSNVSVGKRFERGRLRGWSAELAVRVENLEIDNVDLFASNEIREDEGANLLTTVKATLARDRTDNRFIPTTGDRLRMGYEQFGVLGGDHGFGKLTAGYTRYTTLHTDFLGRKYVLRLRAEGGVILGDAPVPERFFAGGTGSIRGFAYRGVGLRDGIDDNNVGGDFLVLLGSEYAFPLYGDNLRGMLFLDTAAVGSGNFRAAVGSGVRLTLQFFGPVPLEFNFAVPVSQQSGDETQVFSFLIGRLF